MPAAHHRSLLATSVPGILKLEELTWRRLLELDREQTIAVVPISPIEEHGPHLPLGVDFFDAEAFGAALGRELARRRPSLNVLLHPAVPLGTDTFKYLGSIEIRQSVIRDLAIDIGGSLGREGFRRVVLLSSHGGPCHNVALDEAAATLWRKGIRTISPFGAMVERLFLGEYNDRIEAFMRGAGVADLPLPLNMDYHAGAIETSLMLWLKPSLVTEERKALEPFAVKLFDIRPWTALREGPGLGYLGAPAAGDAEFGRGLVELLASEMATLCEGLLDGKDVRRSARSRIYWVPIFWTNRRRWAAALALFLLLVAAWACGVLRHRF